MFMKHTQVFKIAFLTYSIIESELPMHIKVHLRWVKSNAEGVFLSLSLLNMNIKMDSLWTHGEAMSLSL